ncbi:GNAT family N-acetyltransferase [Cohnella sp. JJ-181]|uniref:GNAT family N-acetyltransferase n=1 Tax=Cohnella rhizoplanae TaxID=2974897 RepID=UPI0022FFB314|nr:GNAT family N-acetyltransferase [Cohnella sp. JJ-181]CAI6086618.1 Acetyltransferase [Cohnella sp. JJ-181]
MSDPQFFPLRTERLLLRQVTAEDAEDLYALCADPQVNRLQDWHGPASVADARAIIESWRQGYADKRVIAWGVTLLGRQPLIGTVTLMPTRGSFEDLPRYPLALGYELKPRFWNRGITSEAVRAVLDFSRARVGPHRVQAEVHPDNAASLQVLKKLGFQEEGLLRHYLMHEATRQFMDVIMLALLFN